MTSLAVAFSATCVIVAIVTVVVAAFGRVRRNQRATSECLTDLGIRLAALEAVRKEFDQVTPDEFLHFPPTTQSPMTTDPTPVPAPQPSLRKAALEALVAGEVLLNFDARDIHTWARFRKALEKLAEELGK